MGDNLNAIFLKNVKIDPQEYVLQGSPPPSTIYKNFKNIERTLFRWAKIKTRTFSKYVKIHPRDFAKKIGIVKSAKCRGITVTQRKVAKWTSGGGGGELGIKMVT